MENQTDAQLVERARQGEHAALAELFRRYWRAARAAAYTVLADLNLAEDAASEALSVAMVGLKGLKEPEKFAAWLHTIVVRTAKQSKQARQKRQRIEQKKPGQNATESPETTLEQKEWIELLRETVEQLPPKQREAIMLFYFEGYSVEQAAAFVDAPGGTFKRRLHDGRKSLRHAVDQINTGTRPTASKRQEIIQKLEDLLHHKRDHKHVQEVIHQAMKLRPYPRDLMGKIFKQHVAKQYDTPAKREELARGMQKVVDVVAKPSSRAQDSTHPLGQIVKVIKQVAPDFEPWQSDPKLAVQRMMHVFSGHTRGLTQGLPPGIAKGEPCAYLYQTRSLFFKDHQGIWRSMMEMGQLQERPNEDIWKTAGLSDMLVLQWIQLNSLDLHAVEQRLRNLVHAVVPDATFGLEPYNSPRYRSGLRLQFEGSTLPAVIGGVLEPWPDLPEHSRAGMLVLCLEAWASAQSGQDIPLDDAKPFMDLMKP